MMNTLHKFVTIAAVSAALGFAALGAAPAAAQGWAAPAWGDQGPGWRDPDWRDRDWGYRTYRYDDGYRPAHDYGYRYDDPDWESGAATIAICPGGYRLGPHGRLCWPD
jgi:hypothetical protein